MAGIMWRFSAFCSIVAYFTMAHAAHQQQHLRPEEPPVSLLAVMRHLRQQGTSEAVQTERAELKEGSTLRERQMLADMGRLEEQLEAWQQTGMVLQKEVQAQQSATEQLKEQQKQVIQDEQEATAVMRACKVFVCVSAALGLAVSVYVVVLQGKREAKWHAALASTAINTSPEVNAETAATKAVQHALECDVPDVEAQSAEDATEEELGSTDAENAQHEPNGSQPKCMGPSPQVSADVREAVIVPQKPRAQSDGAVAKPAQTDVEPRTSVCEYFSLDEEGHEDPPDCTAEEQWWMD